jgi:hypothetical protein
MRAAAHGHFKTNTGCHVAVPCSCSLLHINSRHCCDPQSTAGNVSNCQTLQTRSSEKGSLTLLHWNIAEEAAVMVASTCMHAPSR